MENFLSLGWERTSVFHLCFRGGPSRFVWNVLYKINNIPLSTGDKREGYVPAPNEQSLRPRRPRSNSSSVRMENVMLLASFSFNRSLFLLP